MDGECTPIESLQPNDQCDTLQRYGLGWGIDPTNLESSVTMQPYQVFPIKKVDDFAIRNEGKKWKSFSHKVQSEHQLQANLTQSLKVPNTPVSIGGGIEMSQKSSLSCEIYGRKLVEYNISVRPQENTADFEAMLSSWIVDRIRQHAELAFAVMREMKTVKIKDEELNEHMKYHGVDELTIKLAPAAANHKLMENEKQALENELCGERDTEYASTKQQEATNEQIIQDTDLNMLVDLCEDFVRTSSVTHFVSAIELGAADYRVVEETKQERRRSMSARVEAPNVATNSAELVSNWTKFAKSTKTRRIGVINEDGERAKSMGVLDRHVLPISERVKMAKLQLALQRVLSDRIEKYYQDVDNQDTKGPFEISIKVNKTSLYFTVKKQTCATTSWRQQSRLYPSFGQNDAAPIFLIPTEDGKENQFYIVYYSKSLPIQGGRYIPPEPSDSIPYYLQVKLNVFGRDKEVRFVAHPTKECRFIFQPSIGFDGSSILKRKTSFYINCHQRHSWDGYLRASPDRNGRTADIHSSRTKDDEDFISLFSLKYITPP